VKWKTIYESSIKDNIHGAIGQAFIIGMIIGMSLETNNLPKLHWFIEGAIILFVISLPAFIIYKTLQQIDKQLEDR